MAAITKAPPASRRRRAAGYIRVSQVGGRTGESFLSPDLQREKIEAWASYKDHDVGGWYIDLDRSGREGVVRPEFERMMADARAKRFDTVAVYRLTRFGRSVADAARRYRDLKSFGIDLVSVTEDIDTSTASGGFMQTLMFAMAEFESERIGEEWRSVHANRRRRGIAHAARPILGYETTGAVITTVDEAEAPIVRIIYEMRLRGAGYGAISTAVAREGFTSKQGHPRIPASSISDILRNVHYSGRVRLDDGSLIEATHPAIITPELFDTVQRMRPRTAAVSRSRAALLSGLVVCSGCGYRMLYERGRGDASHAHKRNTYRCSARARANPCVRQVSILGDPLDDIVERLFLERLDPKRMPNLGKLSRGRQQASWERRADALRGRVDDIRVALDQLADQRFVSGTLEDEEYRHLTGRYLEDRAAMQAQISELEQLASTVQPLSADVISLWPRLPLDRRQQALRLAIGRIEVRPSPRKGAQQDKLIPQRISVEWIR